MIKKVDADYGTVSHGTMRPQDILPACMDVLAEYAPDAYGNLVDAIRDSAEMTYESLIANDDSDWWRSDDCDWILNEDIWLAMQDIAPDGFYFGSHPGDGSDFGFWSDDDWD